MSSTLWITVILIAVVLAIIVIIVVVSTVEGGPRAATVSPDDAAQGRC